MAALYLATTLSYTFYFKHHVILDVMFISAGFLWRAAAGAVAIGVVISPWLLTCTAFPTLFIGFNKRRSELGLMAESNATRKNLMHYTPELLASSRPSQPPAPSSRTPCTPSWAHHPRGSCSPCPTCSTASSGTSSW